MKSGVFKSALLALILLASPFTFAAGDCNSRLTKIAPPAAASAIWKKAFLNASGPYEAEQKTYALAKFALLNAKSLQFDSEDKSQLKNVIFNLELLAFKEAQKTRGLRIPVTLATFLGISQWMTPSIFGLPAPKMAGIKSAAGAAFYTFGPFLWSLMEFSKISQPTSRIGMTLEKAAESYKLVKSKDMSDLSTQVDTAMDHVYARAPRKSWHTGRATMPVLVALASFALIDASPREIAQHYMIENPTVSYNYRHYHDSEFLADAERQIGNIDGGKTLILYSDDLFKPIDTRENAAMADDALNGLDKSNVTTLKYESLSRTIYDTDISSYDTIVVLVHGFPDSLANGFPATSDKKMKKGANIVFLSCLVGQKGGWREEKWVQFSRRFLDGGKAIVATKILSASLTPANAGKKLSPSSDRYHSIFDIALDGTGAMPFIELSLNAAWAFQNEYYYQPKGIRVYDSVTDRTEFYPSVEPE